MGELWLSSHNEMVRLPSLSHVGSTGASGVWVQRVRVPVLSRWSCGSHGGLQEGLSLPQEPESWTQSLPGTRHAAPGPSCRPGLQPVPSIRNLETVETQWIFTQNLALPPFLTPCAHHVEGREGGSLAQSSLTANIPDTASSAHPG